MKMEGHEDIKRKSGMKIIGRGCLKGCSGDARGGVRREIKKLV